jgi:protein-disulfide isomerase
MADAGDSKSPALHGCVGSTPTSGTRVLFPRGASRGTLSSMKFTIRTFALVAFVAGCSSSSSKVPVTIASPTPPASPTLASEEPPRLTNQELIALERSAGSTPPLAQEVEPSPPPVAGLDGTPGVSPAYGPEDAPVRIYLFTDFQCPVCPRVVEPIKYLARAYPKDVRIVLKENPLPIHNRAARLAAASLAAFRQGKFWEFHDRLFANTSHLEDADLIALAQTLGLDTGRFQRDLDDESVTAQVTYEAALAKSLDLGSTPGLLINGIPQMGWGSYMSLEGHVKRELERARKIAAGGVPPSRLAYEATRQSGPNGNRVAAALFATPK